MKESLLEEFLCEADYKRLAERWVDLSNIGKKPSAERTISIILAAIKDSISKDNKNKESDPKFKQRFTEELKKIGFQFVVNADEPFWGDSLGHQVHAYEKFFIFFATKGPNEYVISLLLPYRENLFNLVKEIVDHKEILYRLAKRVEFEGMVLRGK
jgi:hypothetical protein